MANFEIIMPKMGESIEEATITNWFVKEGDQVVEDDVLLEIATDKVDSEIPSPVAGVVKKILFNQDEVVAVGTVIAVIDTDGESGGSEDGDGSGKEQTETGEQATTETSAPQASGSAPQDAPQSASQAAAPAQAAAVVSSKDRFYSPLVRKIAKEENISQEELDAIDGSGLNGRVQKRDIMNYLQQRGKRAETGASAATAAAAPEPGAAPSRAAVQETAQASKPSAAPVKTESGDEVIEMSRLRKLIAEHMIRSKQTSAHVTNMIEIDVTGVVNWRNSVKEDFLRKEGVKLTYLPVFLEATVKALREFPRLNASVDGERIIHKKRINLGVAVSLPENNLIVPNIKDADTLNLVGITKKMNELAASARSNKLSPDDISGGTFTVTNFGTFQNDIGTPIINQPEVAILAVGAIKKKPAVVETEMGDVIAIRHKMWLSLTYDHRIIDGALGGAFLKRLGDIIESFDPVSGNFKS
jgi:2-oxoglutarate dehydrogenase E2 component (dihydrolipoamide succinyltransferase)